jgi:hypothetical protein
MDIGEANPCQRMQVRKNRVTYLRPQTHDGQANSERSPKVVYMQTNFATQSPGVPLSQARSSWTDRGLNQADFCERLPIDDRTPRPQLSQA